MDFRDAVFVRELSTANRAFSWRRHGVAEPAAIATFSGECLRSADGCTILPDPVAKSGLWMSIDHASVRRIARLARLAVCEAELPQLAAELSRVLELADQLAGAALDGVEPMAHPHAQALAWRADVVSEGDRADALLALAPDARGGLYLVPKVIE
jgi:aspartyl-tRNA(Asn)/glutamyl-tRNA(Gln) amidotransferase subunit C